ncbi:MAG: CorA family divalent cation transporter [Candidatus Aenigmatarchaeota archaeon]
MGAENTEKIEIGVSPSNGANGKEKFDYRGFCAALYDDGVTKKSESNNVADFFQMISKAEVAWIDYVVDDFENESLKIAQSLGFSELLAKNMLKCTGSGYEDFLNEVGILLPAMRVSGFEVNLDPLLILIKKNAIVTIHTRETKRFFRVRRYAETLLRKFPKKTEQNDKITLLLARIIDENNARNFDHLREIEEQGDKMSQDLSDPKTPRQVLGPKIYQMKHALIVYLGGLWSTVDALNSIRYGDADLLTDDDRVLGRISGLLGEVHSQIGLAEHLSEVLASGLEVLQSIYNNQLQVLNNRLAMLAAYLAIISTALLVPNTIATIAGNEMFGFTSGDITWYLTMLVISAVLGTIATWAILKKSGLLPSKPE